MESDLVLRRMISWIGSKILQEIEVVLDQDAHGYLSVFVGHKEDPGRFRCLPVTSESPRTGRPLYPPPAFEGSLDRLGWGLECFTSRLSRPCQNRAKVESSMREGTEVVRFVLIARKISLSLRPGESPSDEAPSSNKHIILHIELLQNFESPLLRLLILLKEVMNRLKGRVALEILHLLGGHR